MKHPPPLAVAARLLAVLVPLVVGMSAAAPPLEGHAQSLAEDLAQRQAGRPVSDPGDAQAVFARVAPSVVTVIAHAESGGFGGQGSGVVVGRGQVATNCHVVREAGSLSVRHASAELPARWTRADRSRDLCLLEVEGLQAPAVRVRPQSSLAVGERVHGVGNPLGFGLAVTSGLISHFPTIDGEVLILSSAPQSPGSSGGGLFDDAGQLVGLTTSVFSAGQNLNLTLPADWIAELATRGVAPLPPPATPDAEPQWVADADALGAAARWPALEQHAHDWISAQPTTARARLELARALLGMERHTEGEAALREAIRLDEHIAEAWRLLAVTLEKNGRFAEAEQALARTQAIEPGAAGTYSLRAAWLLAKGDAHAALAQIERALAFDPFMHRHWSQLGAIQRALGDPGAAQRAFQTALDLNQHDEETRGALARLLAEGGRADEAHRTLAGKAGGGASDAPIWLEIGITDFNRQHYAPAEDAFRKAVAADPDYAEGWEKLGMTLARTLRDDELASVLDRAIALNPALFEARLERAELRGRRGNPQDARADARKLTELAPDEPRAWRTLARHSITAQDPRGAAAAFRRIDALGKADASDLAILGDLLDKLGDQSGALATLTRAEQLDPRHPSALNNLAAFHGRRGDIDTAQRYIERTLANDPRNSIALSSKGYIQLLRGQPAAAAATLEQAVLYDPTLANGWINLGHAHLRNRDVGRAIPALEKALSIAPQALDAHLYLAQAHLATRAPAKARAHAETVLARQPESPDALGVATLADLMEGSPERAAATFTRLRALDPQAADRTRAQAIAASLAGALNLPD
nr:tetratricopeptide repeat protein [Zoogloeaceae bacterium]